jgi:hypothetical protein
LYAPRVAAKTEKRAIQNDKLIVLFSETEAAKQNQKFPFHFLSAPPTPPAELNQKGRKVFGFCPRESASAPEARSTAIGAYIAVRSHHARGACEVIDFGNRCELGTIETPEWNLAVENQPRSGRAEGTPTLFRLIFKTNSDSRLRRDGLFVRQETGAKSEAILTHSICFDTKKNFCLFILFSYTLSAN